MTLSPLPDHRAKAKGRATRASRRGRAKGRTPRAKAMRLGDGMRGTAPTYVTRTGTTVDGVGTGDQFVSLIPCGANAGGNRDRNRFEVTMEIGTVHRRAMSNRIFQLQRQAVKWTHPSKCSISTWHGGTLAMLIFHIGRAAGEFISLRVQG